MKRLAAAMLLTALAALPAGAWEADTTHAGLTEQAALASTVHETLTKRHGQDLGWYQPLAVPREGAAALYGRLRVLPPSSGFVPDARGEQSALAWLLAGTVLEDLPAGRAANHFFDPVHNRGLSAQSGLMARLFFRGASSPAGKPAPDWVVDPTNDLNVARFWRELEQSATAAGKAERDMHLAYALLAAGALLHVLEDMGSPSRVRDDWSEHLHELGGGKPDRGSRFERLAALMYGRLGVPAPDKAERRGHVRDYLTGLAEHTNTSWFSFGTLPGTDRFPKPSLSAKPPVGAPSDSDWAQVERDGVCLVDRRMVSGRQELSISDECAAEQIADILPTVGAYATGLLELLFRGKLDVSLATGEIVVTTTDALGAGTVRILSEDGKGERHELTSAKVTSAQAGGTLVSLPMDGTPAHVVAVFTGVDGTGEQIVSVGAFQPPGAIQ
jgi:hypothetical protein